MDVVSSRQNDTQVPSPVNLLTTPSSRETPAAQADERATLLKEAGDLRTHLRLVCTRINALLPISLIPPAILSRIFRLFRDDVNDVKDGIPREQRSWMRVSFVCRHWRQVALDDPALWSRIVEPERNPEYLSEMLSRSKNSSLGIIIDSPPTPKLFDTLSELLPRIDTLSLPVTVDQDPQVQRLLRSKAPVLKEFTLGVSSWSSSPYHNGSTQDGAIQPIEPTVFDGQAPKLKKLHLGDFTIPWLHLPQCSLTHLHVTATSKSAYSQTTGSLDQLIDVLSDSGPSLEVLTLRDCWSSTPVGAQFARRASVVKLPRLHQLDLSGSSPCIAHLSESLETPSLTELGVYLTAKDDAEVALWPAIASTTVSRFDRADLPEFRSLQFTLNPSSDLATTVEASMAEPTPRSRRHSYSSNQTCLTLRFFYEYAAYRGSIDVLQTLCSTPSMSTVNYLTISSPSNYLLTSDWVELFQPCAGILSLELFGSGTESLLRAMKRKESALPVNSVEVANIRAEHPVEGDGSSASSQDRGKPVVEPSIFPQLASLSLTWLDLTKNIRDASDYDKTRSVPDASYWTGRPPFRLRDAVDLIKLRKDWDVKIDQLEIRESRIHAEDADELMSLVPNFYWDKEEGEPSDPEENSDDDNDDDDD
ncbi:hypothetical protein BC834DRAFT_1042112 [Gloeopeniophorella convolvens]|nr:hypothetical protein BC834DRAFT_1042112 [Gloeopeniophorella convolvens]